MDILIVGGGMAGWTLAGHLARRGITPTLVERVPEYRRVGFSIGLYPFSANTLRETGAFGRYADRSLWAQDYLMSDAHGGELSRMSVAEVFGRAHGGMGMLHRADLLDVLREAAPSTNARMGTTVTALEQTGERVRATLSSGESLDVDLVVGADGIHSQVRELVLGPLPVDDWGVTALTWWTPPQPALGRNVQEFWGASTFFGLYPIADAVCAIGAIPTPPDAATMAQPAMRDLVHRSYADFPPLVQEALSHLDSGEIHLWPMIDQRSPEWVIGRIALVGDAAAGFLPTAGMGASNAIKSAAVLADELGRSDAAGIPLALALWEQRMRERVEHNQDDSRKLAKLMFVRHQSTARARDLLLRHYPVAKLADQLLANNVQAF
jgi:2-polyprenyl-6-methoxyphenol hydroxylase-like FAD-dependent oxidoreductase